MKIVLFRKKNQGSQSAQEYMKTVFSHISHELWIKKVESGTLDTNPNIEVIIVKGRPQGSVLENEELAEKVAKAVSLRGDLQLKQITIKPTMQVPAIKQTNSSTYEINAYFADFVARKPEYCESLRTSNVAEVKIEYKRVSPTQIKNTGKIATTTRPPQAPFQLGNPYQCFAQTLTDSSTLKAKVQQDNVEQIVMQINPQQQSGKIAVVTADAFDLSFPQAQNQVQNLNRLFSQASIAGTTPAATPAPTAEPAPAKPKTA